MTKRSREQVQRRQAIAAEFGAELGDARRTARLVAIGERLAEKPDASFFAAFPAQAEREAFYRFVRSEHTDVQNVLSAHRAQTVARVTEKGTFLVLHDTTEFRFRLADGVLRRCLHQFSQIKQGFRCHVSLATSADGLREPLGFLAVRGFVPADASPEVKEFWDEQFGELHNHNDRWFDAVAEVEKQIAGVASAIHVMDAEADFLQMLAMMHEHGYRYIIRAKHDRSVRTKPDGRPKKVGKALARCKFVAEREVELSPRPISNRPPAARKKHPPRSRRTATISFRFRSLIIDPPVTVSNARNQPTDYKPLTVTVIEGLERNPPDGESPIRWILLTNEVVGSIEDMLRLVDMYRSRWLIEEAFKAIKTGCAFEERQLESADTLLVGLGLLLPLAWRLLLLRHLERYAPDMPATVLLSSDELAVLRVASKTHRVPPEPSASDVCLAIARLGGWSTSNGPPGWQVIGRGLDKLLTLTEGYVLMRNGDPEM